VELARLTVTMKDLDHVADVVHQRTEPVTVEGGHANATMIVASLRDRLTGPIGVWLEISEDFSAPLAARDVATLSWLVQLDRVVVAAADNASAHADVVRALLTNDEVNFANDVATLRGAYNRPAPPRPLEVWHYDASTLRHEDVVLVERSRVTTAAGELTIFG
jgi:hypothetical protein